MKNKYYIKYMLYLSNDLRLHIYKDCKLNHFHIYPKLFHFNNLFKQFILYIFSQNIKYEQNKIGENIYLQKMDIVTGITKINIYNSVFLKIKYHVIIMLLLYILEKMKITNT